MDSTQARLTGFVPVEKTGERWVNIVLCCLMILTQSFSAAHTLNPFVHVFEKSYGTRLLKGFAPHFTWW